MTMCNGHRSVLVRGMASARRLDSCTLVKSLLTASTGAKNVDGMIARKVRVAQYIICHRPIPTQRSTMVDGIQSIQFEVGQIDFREKDIGDGKVVKLEKRDMVT